ncbi:MAG TPA: ATP-binding protein [Ktedonobacterales bacterium]
MRLTAKLALAFVVVSVIGVGVAAIFVQVMTQNSFQTVVNSRAESDFETAVTGYYQQTGSWTGVNDFIHHPQGPGQGPGQGPNGGQGPPPGQGEQNAPNGSGGPPPPFILVNQQNVVVVAGPTHPLGDVISAQDRAHGTPVMVNGQAVGVVLLDGSAQLNPAESQFLTSTQQALIIGMFAALLVALAIGFILARTLTRPTRELTAALDRVAGGELRQAVPVRSRDELGQLTAAFNRMSADLARANEQRRQMTADIAHDLRSPVTVLAGYLEALRDGVLPPTPERFAVLYDSAAHLRRLIEDLRTLSLSDAGELVLNCEPVAPRALLQRIAEVYEHQAERQGVTLRIEAPEPLPPARIDAERMVQVLSNLVSNALRYTPSGGTISLAAARSPQATLLGVRDTGQGIRPEALPLIFDRFYRADRSRAQSEGESGLGLSIAKALVEAHGGTISVSSEPGQGTTFTILLPDEKSLITS